MLLDEPTNNLDYKAINWLTKFLQDTNCGIIMVSHDEDFLEKIVNTVFELNDGKVTRYNMKLSEYFNEKEWEYQREFSEYQKNMDRREAINETLCNLQRINDKHENKKKKDNNKAGFDLHKSQVQKKGAAKVTRLEKELESIDVSFREREKINYKFNYKDEKGNKDIKLINLVCGYKDFQTKEINMVIPFGSRVNIVGVNGSGKTTLIKTILGEIEPIAGQVEKGSNIKAGYISQNTLIKDREGDVYYTDGEGCPVQDSLVLVNENTASASEIFTLALMENNKAKVVGVKTYGKGSVQETQMLESGAMVKYTIAYWYSPSGKSINKIGITPDIEESNISKQLDKALEVVRK